MAGGADAAAPARGAQLRIGGPAARRAGQPGTRGIMRGDAREVLASLPDGAADLSFWSSPYVGKSHEKHRDFAGWQVLLRGVVGEHGGR